MVDKLTSLQRQICMSRNKGKDTKPEIVIRKLIHSLGYRYRLHRKNLPGCPDLVFASRKKVIFVNGCFWHRHSCKKGRSIPKTRNVFWEQKFKKTKARDKSNYKKLKADGWKIMIIWECQMKNKEELCIKIINFLDQKLNLMS